MDLATTHPTSETARSSRLRWVMISFPLVAIFALLMTSAIPAILVTNVWASVAWISVATFGYTGYNSNALAFPPDVFPKNMVASV